MAAAAMKRQSFIPLPQHMPYLTSPPLESFTAATSAGTVTALPSANGHRRIASIDTSRLPRGSGVSLSTPRTADPAAPKSGIPTPASSAARMSAPPRTPVTKLANAVPVATTTPKQNRISKDLSLTSPPKLSSARSSMSGSGLRRPTATAPASVSANGRGTSAHGSGSSGAESAATMTSPRQGGTPATTTASVAPDSATRSPVTRRRSSSIAPGRPTVVEEEEADELEPDSSQEATLVGDALHAIQTGIAVKDNAGLDDLKSPHSQAAAAGDAGAAVSSMRPSTEELLRRDLDDLRISYAEIAFIVAEQKLKIDALTEELAALKAVRPHAARDYEHAHGQGYGQGEYDKRYVLAGHDYDEQANQARMHARRHSDDSVRSQSDL